MTDWDKLTTKEKIKMMVFHNPLVWGTLFIAVLVSDTISPRCFLACLAAFVLYPIIGDMLDQPILVNIGSAFFLLIFFCYLMA